MRKEIRLCFVRINSNGWRARQTRVGGAALPLDASRIAPRRWLVALLIRCVRVASSWREHVPVALRHNFQYKRQICLGNADTRPPAWHPKGTSLDGSGSGAVWTRGVYSMLAREKTGGLGEGKFPWRCVYVCVWIMLINIGRAEHIIFQ